MPLTRAWFCHLGRTKSLRAVGWEVFRSSTYLVVLSSSRSPLFRCVLHLLCISLRFCLFVVIHRVHTTNQKRIFAISVAGDGSVEHIKFVTNFKTWQSRPHFCHPFSVDTSVEPRRDQNHNTNRESGTAAPFVHRTVNVYKKGLFKTNGT